MDPEPIVRGPERDETNRALKAVTLGALLGFVLSVLARRRG
jgi:hypothetical protein